MLASKQSSSTVFGVAVYPVLQVKINTERSVRVTVSSPFMQTLVYHSFLNSQSPLRWNAGKP